MPDSHLHIGAIIFPKIDQCDFTGPFEVLSRLPDSTFHVLWKEKTPVRDNAGLILTPEKTFFESPQLDVLIVPGGHGQEALMEDEVVLSFICEQARNAKYVFSVCTGALLCGAAGLLKDKRATTHWTAFHLLKYFGAIPVNARVVVDGNLITAAGVTSGLDAALQLASLLRGKRMAQVIQLSIQYAPEPPFASGTPETAPAEVLQTAQALARKITETRLQTAQRIADRLGVKVQSQPGT
jgi:cyclohexyl-isocyanide hydratase